MEKPTQPTETRPLTPSEGLQIVRQAMAALAIEKFLKWAGSK